MNKMPMNNVPTIGVIANPASGRDIRRLVASAPTATLAEKYTIVRRIVVGAVEAGVQRILFLDEPHRISERAIETLHLPVSCEVVGIDARYDESDTVRTATAMHEAGASVIVTLGGDGTNRAVTLGQRDTTLLPISTGTNNVFPDHIEATVAGHAAGLVATHAVPRAQAARQAKVIDVAVENEQSDLALIDAVLVDERLVGSRALFDPDVIRVGLLTRAEPAAVGMSSIGGALAPCGFMDDGGVAIAFGGGHNHLPDGLAGRPVDQQIPTLRSPLAPGLYAELSIEAVTRLPFGEALRVRGPGILAFDGERHRQLGDGQIATLTVTRSGPHVIDPAATMRAAILSRGPSVN